MSLEEFSIILKISKRQALKGFTFLFLPDDNYRYTYPFI